MPDLKYKDIPIEVTASGQFRAVVNQQPIVKPSMAAMKKAIDQKDVAKFEPFTALRHDSWRDALGKVTQVCKGLVRVKIVDLVMENARRRGGGASPMFVEEGGIRHDDVIDDTPENITAFVAHLEYEEESRKLSKDRDEMAEKMRRNIALVKPEDYLKGKS